MTKLKFGYLRSGSSFAEPKNGVWAFSIRQGL